MDDLETFLGAAILMFVRISRCLDAAILMFDRISRFLDAAILMFDRIRRRFHASDDLDRFDDSMNSIALIHDLPWSWERDGRDRAQEEQGGSGHGSETHLERLSDALLFKLTAKSRLMRMKRRRRGEREHGNFTGLSIQLYRSQHTCNRADDSRAPSHMPW